MKLVNVIKTLISIAIVVSTGIVQCEELKRDKDEQAAFEHGCDLNQMNMNICSYYDFKVQDAKLNELYKKQIARLKGSVHEKRLINAQRAWLKYVDADCLYQNGPREESGTIWALEENGCRTLHTQQRIKLLESFIACDNNGCPGE